MGDGTSYCSDPGSTNEDFLYLVYSQNCGPTPEEQNDISAHGICNAELYLTASFDGGYSWSVPRNLTNTKTPGCDPQTDPSTVCSSEMWATIARNVSDINVSYILDYEAGDFTSSGWVFNDYMYIQYPAGTDAQHVCPLVSPKLKVTLDPNPGCEFNVPPGESVQDTLFIDNTANAALNGDISIIDGQEFLSLGFSGPFAVPAGDPGLPITVTMDADTLPEGLYSGTIQVFHNDTSQAIPFYIPIDFYVSDELVCPGLFSSIAADLSGDSTGVYQIAFADTINEQLTIQNTGASTLFGSIYLTGGQAFVSLDQTGAYYIEPGGPDIVVPMTIDGAAVQSGSYQAAIEITHNDTTQPDPLIIALSVEVSCDCPTLGDPVVDGVVDVFDVIAAVDVAFRSASPTYDPDCLIPNTDVTCNGVTDVFDIVAFVDVAFRSKETSEVFCAPCG